MTYDHVAFEYFKKFSRFEFALKSSGYIYTDNHKKAFADWNRFIEEKGVHFNPEDSISNSLEYLRNRPPKSLYFEDEEMIWKEFSPEAGEFELVLWRLKTTRNNLFHGNKMFRENSIERNIELIEHCTTILEFLTELDDNIHANYHLQWE